MKKRGKPAARGSPTYDEPLARGNAYIFVLILNTTELSDLLTKAHACRIRISIHSNGGEICRVQKKDVLMYLNSMAEQNNKQN